MSLLLAALMIVSITSCGKTEQNVDSNDVNEPSDNNDTNESVDNNDVNEPADNNDVNEPADSDEEPKEIKYVFYSGGYTDGGGSASQVGFLNVSALQFSDNYQRVLDDGKTSADKYKTLTVDGVKYDFSYSSVTQRSEIEDKKSEINKYNACHNYVISSGTHSGMLTIYSTGELKYLLIVNSLDDGNASSKEDLLVKANSVLCDFYGEDALNNYYLRNEDDYSEANAVVYQRKFHGYVADTSLSVYFDSAGEVQVVNAGNHFDFNAIENDVTAEMIQQADEALRAQIPSSMTVQEDATKVMIDFNTGKLYLRMYARRNTSVIDPETGMETHTGEDFYVNIN